VVLVDHGHGPARFRVRTDSRAATFEQAKADFQAAWVAFKAANDSDSQQPQQQPQPYTT
jgi:hypothetical protein